ncbi:MAG: hypothetical protein INQ03_12500 [Candidatus Heimdallarchaeota archaeon]|nr:hypothetical protein [Candidatus Heimdallarchaeota archaeon]
MTYAKAEGGNEKIVSGTTYWKISNDEQTTYNVVEAIGDVFTTLAID